MKVNNVEFAESLGRQEFDKKFEEDITKYSESELLTDYTLELSYISFVSRLVSSLYINN
jgi:hypothetical protein